MDISHEIAAIAAETLPADLAIQKYKELCNSLVGSQLADQAQTLLDHLITGNVPKTVTSPSLNYLTEEIKKFKSNDELKSLCRYGLEKFRQFPNAFDRAEANLKGGLADLYIDEDEFLKAASVLAEIDLERGSFDAVYKGTINVRIAELFADDSIGDVHKADTFIKKARQHMREVTDHAVSLRYVVIELFSFFFFLFVLRRVFLLCFCCVMLLTCSFFHSFHLCRLY